MNDNTTPQAEIDASSRWEQEKEKADRPLDAATCPACGGSGLGKPMYRPEIDKTQRDRCYTCKGTGAKPPTFPITLDKLARHLIYGDIEEMTLSILGDDCPSDEQFAGLDQEQQTRLAAAATVLACLQGRLHPGGYLMTNTFRPSEC